MNLKQSLHRGLIHARGVSEKFLRAFQTPEHWTHQLFPGANHALWFAGHMATLDNFFISIIAPDRARAMPGYEEKFGLGSQPTNRPSDYPPADEVLECMRERRAVLLEVFAALSDEDLSRPTPPGTPKIFPDVTSIFEGAVWHEGMHSGQISVVRRALGNSTLYAGPLPT